MTPVIAMAALVAAIHAFLRGTSKQLLADEGKTMPGERVIPQFAKSST
jgi:hypothetical protein